MLLREFNRRSNTWNKNIQQQSRMVQLPENMINGYELYITTELPYTFKRSNNSGKIRIDLTFVKVLKNGQVKAKEL